MKLPLNWNLPYTKIALIGLWLVLALPRIWEGLHDNGAHAVARLLGSLTPTTILVLAAYLALIWGRKRQTAKNVASQTKGKEGEEYLRLPGAIMFGCVVLLVTGVAVMVVFDPFHQSTAQVPPVPFSIEWVQPPPRPKLTEAQRKAMLESGIVPEMYEYGQPPLEPRVTVPKEVRYIITVTLTAGVNTFASRWEPKPFGNGFKFIDFNTGKEMIVSGGVQIVKVNN